MFGSEGAVKAMTCLVSTQRNSEMSRETASFLVNPVTCLTLLSLGIFGLPGPGGRFPLHNFQYMKGVHYITEFSISPNQQNGGQKRKGSHCPKSLISEQYNECNTTFELHFS